MAPTTSLVSALCFTASLLTFSRAVATSIRTTSGSYIGHPAPQACNVTEYLGIRYAEPATGPLRFAAPVAFNSTETFQASVQPSDCPYVARDWGSVPGESYSHAERIMAQESADGYNAMSEDCLKLNIWAPDGGGSSKPVMVFVYGGGFERGSINNPAYNGVYMADREDVIVVSFNYRVNIFGFSNAPGSDTNVGIRDMRLAVEWIRNNIVAFGGDPSHITLFGQSQGAWLISYYAYAYKDDPIASSFIQQSGSAFSTVSQNATVKTAIWRNASATVGCDQASDAAVLECMRAQNVSTVLAAWAAVQEPTLPLSPVVDGQFAFPAYGNRLLAGEVALKAALSLPLGPVVDNELVFANYTEKTLAGEFAQKPVLMGSNANEAGFYAFRLAGTNTFVLNQTEQDIIGYGLFFCPVVEDAGYKSIALAKTDASIYRYEYFGDWPNLRLYPGSGAYHTSETSMVFGTMADLSGDENTALQVQVSEYMQHAWTSFARDPAAGLKGLGWPSYNGSESTLIRLGYGEETTATFVNPAEYDTICTKLAKEV